MGEQPTRKPATDVEWNDLWGREGKDGVSRCYPQDEETKQLLDSYGQNYVQYNKRGEPDFTPFSVTAINVPDMTSDRGKNFALADKKLLDTKWAKERDLTTVTQIKQYRSENRLTLHECPDGVTIQLVDQDIHRRFAHNGGVAKMKMLESEEADFFHSPEYIRVHAQKTVARTGEKIQEPFRALSDKLEENGWKEIHDESLNAATNAAIFAGAISIVENIRDVTAGKKEGQEAARDVVQDTAGAAGTAYAMKAISMGIQKGIPLSDEAVSVLATGSVKIARSAGRLVQGQLTSEEFQEEVAETAGMVMAAYIGKEIGGFIGAGAGAVIGGLLIPGVGGEIGAWAGEKVGKFIGEMITTAVCSSIIEETRRMKRRDKAFEAENRCLTELAREAEKEIRVSQERMKEMIEKENRELLEVTGSGYRQMMDGILEADYTRIYSGILQIGSKFGLEETELSRGTVKKGSIFEHRGEVLAIS